MRLVASDVDGTIMGHDGVISARTRAALGSLDEAGVELVFVTGRPIRWLGPLTEQLGHRGTVICSNGAVVWDLEREELVAVHALNRAEVLHLRELILQVHPEAGFAAECLDGSRIETAYFHAYGGAKLALEEARPLADSLLEDTVVVKFLAASPVLTSEEFHALLAPVLAGLAHVTHSDGRYSLLEMSAAGVTKARTLEAFAGSRGISAAEVVAFGDMPNDVQMLEWAGEGYAMAGGHPEALAAARFRAPACEDDGVAQVLEEKLRSLETGKPGR